MPPDHINCNIPILWRHDPNQSIGHADAIDSVSFIVRAMIGNKEKKFTFRPPRVDEIADFKLSDDDRIYNGVYTIKCPFCEKYQYPFKNRILIMVRCVFCDRDFHIENGME